MKLAAAAVAVVLSCAPARARAESSAESAAPFRFDSVTLDHAYKRARTRRNLGIALAAPGVAASVVGAILLAYGVNDPNLLGGGLEIGTGILFETVGLALGIPGSIFWTGGQDDMDVVKWRRKQMLEPFFSARREGGAAGLRITF